MNNVTRRITRRLPVLIHSGGKERNIILEISPLGKGSPGPGYLGFRLERTRMVYYLPAAFCFREAIKADAVARQAERKRKRQAV